MPLSQSDSRTGTFINWNIYHLQVTTKVIYQNNISPFPKCQAIRPSEQSDVMRKRNVTVHSFTPHKGAFQDPFQHTYCSYCVSHKDTSAPTLTCTAARCSLFKWQPPFKKKPASLSLTPIQRHASPVAIFPGLCHRLPTASPMLPLPSTQLKLPVCDLLFFSVELTAQKGSSLLALNVQRSQAHQECSLYDVKRGLCHIITWNEKRSPTSAHITENALNTTLKNTLCPFHYVHFDPMICGCG